MDIEATVEARIEEKQAEMPEESARRTEFQYPDWHFDDDDITYLIRTAYDRAPNYHDANRITFGMVEDFRARSE